jgi:hypothetical protein
VGIEGNVGIALNPGWVDGEQFDVGLTFTGGVGYGENISGEIAAGLIKGSIENVRGHTKNINVGVGRFSGTIITKPYCENPYEKYLGGTLGYGVSATPVTASVTHDYTLLWSARETLELIGEIIDMADDFLDSIWP